MAGLRRGRKVALIPIAHYEAQDAANTIARAREHLANPKMVRAIRQHLDGMNEALAGGLKPKKPRPTRAPRGMAGGL